jgi:hypothetical protein
MVVGIIKSKDDSLRMLIEDRFAKAFENQNYHVVPASAEFGAKGLAGLGETDTYIKLCNKGIDAVITITLIDGTKEVYNTPGYMNQYPASYYFSRIWNYKNIQADLTGNSIGNDNPNFWEIIVYDLNTLEALCTIQTKSFLEITDSKIADNFAKQVVDKMFREKILAKKKNQSKLPRPF